MLILSVLRCPDAVPPETKRVQGGEFRIGRGPDNDWIMPDPDKMLSKRHCVVAFRNGGWALADTSTNGTFVNRDSDPVGQGQIRNLTDGDRIRFGAYEIEVRIEPDEFGNAPGFGRGAAKPASPFDDPFGDDPFAPPAPSRGGDNFREGAFGNDPLFGGPPPSQNVALPSRYDPLGGPPSDDDYFSATPATPDHSPSFSDAFRPPPVAPKLIPDDDWDLDLPGMKPAAPPAPQAFKPAAPDPFAAAPPAPPPAAFSAPPAPLPAAPPPPQPPAPAYAPPPAAGATPFDEPGDTPNQFVAPPPQAAYAQPPPQAAYAQPPPPAAYAPPPPLPPPPAAAPPPVAAAAPAGPGGGADALAQFLAGAALPANRLPDDPAATMRAVGAAFRATVSGIRQALIARSAIKGEFRIEQTMIRARGNNPLKFSADDDDAMAALLGIGRRTDVKPDAAIADALRDMRLHELATMAAMQEAVRALVGRLDPEKLREEGDAAGGLNVLPVQKKAKAFDAYEKLFAQLSRALTDDFDSLFGKAFARAYETALREISARES
jgi:type VI secretion system FHA domain protein